MKTIAIIILSLLGGGLIAALTWALNGPYQSFLSALLKAIGIVAIAFVVAFLLNFSVLVLKG